MNLFETLLHPDREELELADRMIVVSAANLLQVGEFQFLQLAYKDWFGSDLPEALVARLFSSYMLDNDVPHWARHYARLVLIREERGTIDINDAAYHRYDHDYARDLPVGIRRFCAAAGVVTLIMVSTILAASMMVTKPTSILPPYFDQRELRVGEQQDLSGRSDHDSSVRSQTGHVSQQ